MFAQVHKPHLNLFPMPRGRRITQKELSGILGMFALLLHICLLMFCLGFIFIFSLMCLLLLYYGSQFCVFIEYPCTNVCVSVFKHVSCAFYLALFYSVIFNILPYCYYLFAILNYYYFRCL